MAEFGELLPGTEWRTECGDRVLILSQSFIPTRVVPSSGRESYEGRLRNETSNVVGWVPWVEPIAAGDRVEPQDSRLSWPKRGTVRAVFEDDGKACTTVRWDGWLLESWTADRLRKVVDE